MEFASLLIASAESAQGIAAVDWNFLQLLWFVLLGVLLIGYTILDGFDFGVGILHPFVGKTDYERRITINSIGPLWDGNEVWLITFGGALFAAFPEVYATVFSAFYVPFMLLLLALILRAVSLEFRSKFEAGSWRGLWDYLFFGSSALAAILFGAAVGNAIMGLPLEAAGEPVASGRVSLDILREMTMLDKLAYQLSWYPLLCAVFTVTIFGMHGSIYLYLKTEGELQERCKRWVWRWFFAFAAMYVVVTIATLIAHPHVTGALTEFPFLWIIPALNALAVANIPRAMYKGRPAYAFISSCATIAALVFLFGMALFPNLVINTEGVNMTIANTASSDHTLTIMAIIAAVGMPFVLAYTGAVYWTFRGKVELGKFSY
jgi:cytochrome d ubiquinol oxidase subunit II